MLMPKTPVYEDHLPTRPEHEIWFAGKMFSMQTVTVAHAVDNPADGHFRGRISALDRLHVIAAIYGTEMINHILTASVNLVGRLHGRPQVSLVEGGQNSHKPFTDPLGYRRCHSIPDGMIPQAIDPIGLPFVEMPRQSPIFGEALNALNLIGNEPSDPPVWIPDVVPRPVGASVTSRLRINAMCDALYERAFCRISNDCLKEGGRFLSILSVRLKIPVAAFGLKKYFSGTSWVSMYGNNVDSTTLLGDSEVLAVKHTPPHAIPEFVQRLEYDGEVSSSVAREKPVDVLEDNGFWQASSNEPHKVVKETRLDPSKPRSRPHPRK